MRKFLTVLTIMFFCSSVFAHIPAKKFDNMPQGTFKKTRSGKVIQYNQNGKKIGVYKIKNGKYIKVK